MWDLERYGLDQVFTKALMCNSQEAQISMLKDVSGIIKPSRYVTRSYARRVEKIMVLQHVEE